MESGTCPQTAGFKAQLPANSGLVDQGSSSRQA
jgi:hypothetical protein